ncbi:hypothetical protein M422DRAFT_249957 [Sphaerobolus stellatus SS14]|uniref:Uncharacterized protein n=1 Tax=Sphaerobolus stellatus (strain SS14) TaxID=990650 RepID=A0A0C9T725_SPHS4|nr:hypothetical protein M422DRAFT_274362 [Sphaerobolus stellatus SS14]KIJ46366.1 hypothetical protein M422DRAFT_249957 [Sphaerobolus stellatus SS14]
MDLSDSDSDSEPSSILHSLVTSLPHGSVINLVTTELLLIIDNLPVDRCKNLIDKIYSGIPTPHSALQIQVYSHSIGIQKIAKLYPAQVPALLDLTRGFVFEQSPPEDA